MFLDLTPVDYFKCCLWILNYMYMYIRHMLLRIPVSVPAINSWFTFLEVSSDSQLLIKWFYSGRYLHMHVTWNGYSWVNLEILVLQMAQLLITKGAHLNAGDRKDRKPLHWAAHMGKSCTMYLYMQFNLLVRFGQR